MQQQGRTTDQKIARIAAAAKGNVTRDELLGAAITPEEIRQRLKRGSLLPVFRGVYRVGHAAPSVEADYLAAVKASGKGRCCGWPALRGGGWSGSAGRGHGAD